MPGVIMDTLISFLELIKFFKNRDWYDYIMLFKVIYAGGIVEDNVGVENKEFFSTRHNLFLLSSLFSCLKASPLISKRWPGPTGRVAGPGRRGKGVTWKSYFPMRQKLA